MSFRGKHTSFALQSDEKVLKLKDRCCRRSYTALPLPRIQPKNLFFSHKGKSEQVSVFKEKDIIMCPHKTVPP